MVGDQASDSCDESALSVSVFAFPGVHLLVLFSCHHAGSVGAYIVKRHGLRGGGRRRGKSSSSQLDSLSRWRINTSTQCFEHTDHAAEPLPLPQERQVQPRLFGLGEAPVAHRVPCANLPSSRFSGAPLQRRPASSAPPTNLFNQLLRISSAWPPHPDLQQLLPAAGPR